MRIYRFHSCSTVEDVLSKHWKTLLSVVTTAVVVSAAVVTPAAASAASGGVDGGSLAAARAAKVAAGVQILTPGKTTEVVLTSKAKVGVTARIICYVSSWGPAYGGGLVRFELFVSCQGGTPEQLGATMDMYWVYLGESQQVPGSYNSCQEVQFPSLACWSNGPCFQAGTYYDGLADLRAVDSAGRTYSATLYAPLRWVGCPV